MERTYSHIEMDERRKIARWRMAGLTVDVIAEKLGRHRSTIVREIKRNMFVDKVVRDLSSLPFGSACSSALQALGPSADVGLGPRRT